MPSAYFCAVKWKACIALLLLLTPVVVPAAQSVLKIEEVTMMLIDEEKGKDGKAFKVFSPFEEHLIPADYNFYYSAHQDLALFRSGLLTKPYCKRHTQPPDFS